MENVCAIFHKQFDQLFRLTNNYQQAVFLDKCIYWWQISKYTLGTNKIFFTRPYEQLAKEAGISESSVNRYLKTFQDKGFIEKITKLSASNKGEFKVIKRTYIHITEKLLSILNVSVNKDPVREEIHSVFLNQHDIIDNVMLTESICKDQNNNLKNNNTVSESRIVNNVKNNTQSNPNKNYPSYPIEKEIGEQITEQFKNYVKGTMRNLESQHQLVFSNPEQVFAEIIFSVMQVKNQFPGVLDNQHRLNLIAKLLRNKQWRTPKGFFNHWAVGQMFKSKLDKQGKVKEQAHHASNAYDDESGAASRHDYGASRNVTHAVINYQLQAKLKPLKCEYREVLADITTETRFLNDMESRCLIKPDNITKELIASTAMKIARLYEKSVLLDEQIKREERLAA